MQVIINSQTFITLTLLIWLCWIFIYFDSKSASLKDINQYAVTVIFYIFDQFAVSSFTDKLNRSRNKYQFHRGMKIVKKERLDVKKFMEEAKANKTNRSYTSIETKTKPALDSKFDQGRPMGNMYNNSFSEYNERPHFSSYEESRRNYEQSQMAIYNYVPFPTPNEYLMNQPSSFMVNPSSQNYMGGGSPYCFAQNPNSMFTQTQSYQMNQMNQMNHVNQINPINQMRQPLPQHPDHNFINNFAINHSQVSMGSLRKEKQQQMNIKQIDKTVVVPDPKITESIVIEIDQRPEEMSKAKIEEVIIPPNAALVDEFKTAKKKGKMKKPKNAPNCQQAEGQIKMSDIVDDTNTAHHNFDKSKEKDSKAIPDITQQTIQQNIYLNFNSHLETILDNSISKPKYAHFQAKFTKILAKLTENFVQTPVASCSLQCFSESMLNLLY